MVLELGIELLNSSWRKGKVEGQAICEIDFLRYAQMERQVIIYTRTRIKSICATKSASFCCKLATVVCAMCCVFSHLGVCRLLLSIRKINYWCRKCRCLKYVAYSNGALRVMVGIEGNINSNLE